MLDDEDISYTLNNCIEHFNALKGTAEFYSDLNALMFIKAIGIASIDEDGLMGETTEVYMCIDHKYLAVNFDRYDKLNASKIELYEVKPRLEEHRAYYRA